MKTKIFPIFLITIFLIIFLIFFKGLKNSNIYTPNLKLDSNIPKFKSKLFDSESLITSDKIFS